jgi:hypothetical protein
MVPAEIRFFRKAFLKREARKFLETSARPPSQILRHLVQMSAIMISIADGAHLQYLLYTVVCNGTMKKFGHGAMNAPTMPVPLLRPVQIHHVFLPIRSDEFHGRVGNLNPNFQPLYEMALNLYKVLTV